MNIKDKCLNTKNKQFALVSLIIFGIIVLVSFLFFHTCRSESCEFGTASVINLIILTLGTIGLVYCYFELKGFNKIADKKLHEDISDIIEDLHKDKTLINDSTKQENKKDSDKVLSF